MSDGRTGADRRARDLLTVAFGPSGVALAVVAAIVLVQLVVANSDMTGTFGAVASMWLGVHGVPVSLAGRELGVMPLLPMVAMVWGTARATGAALQPARSWFVVRWVLASAVAGPLLVTALALAVIGDAAAVLTALQPPDALRAFGAVVAVHAVGALAGLITLLRHRAGLLRGHVPSWLPEALRAAVAGALTLLGLAAAVTTASLVVHWSTMHDLYSITDSWFGQLSLTALSVLYLPNVVVGAAAVAVGSSAHVGPATFSAFAAFGGQLPPVPALAAAPSPPLAPVWVALLLVGATAGVVLGQQCARRATPLSIALAKVAVASALAAVAVAVLGEAAGGRLGNFGDVGVDSGTFGVAALLWFLAIGALTTAMSGGVAARPARPSPDPRDAGTESDAEADPGPDHDPDPGADPELDAAPEPPPRDGPRRPSEPGPQSPH